MPISDQTLGLRAEPMGRTPEAMGQSPYAMLDPALVQQMQSQIDNAYPTQQLESPEDKHEEVTIKIKRPHQKDSGSMSHGMRKSIQTIKDMLAEDAQMEPRIQDRELLRQILQESNKLNPRR